MPAQARPVLVPLSEGFCEGAGHVSAFMASLQGVPGILREGLISDSRATNLWDECSCCVATGSQVTAEMYLEVGRGFSNEDVL